MCADVAEREATVIRLMKGADPESTARLVDAYVHRVGRTGRAEAAGTALTLVAPEELPALRSIEKSLRLSFAVA